MVDFWTIRAENESRRRASTRRLREIMRDALARQLAELAVPASSAQVLAFVLEGSKDYFTNRSPALGIVVYPDIMTIRL